jgi:hypothetical protein
VNPVGGAAQQVLLDVEAHHEVLDGQERRLVEAGSIVRFKACGLEAFSRRTRLILAFLRWDGEKSGQSLSRHAA